jgi:hypothetical protein
MSDKTWHGDIKVTITGLHKLPFDKACFEKDLESIRDHEPDMRSQLRAQYRENWENAWLVVVEFDGESSQIDFDRFEHNGQAAWDEKIFESRGSHTRAAFYLHYVDHTGVLMYGAIELAFPAPSDPPGELLQAMPYSSPD